jgi:hypothetical protein
MPTRERWHEQQLLENKSLKLGVSTQKKVIIMYTMVNVESNLIMPLPVPFSYFLKKSRYVQMLLKCEFRMDVLDSNQIRISYIFSDRLSKTTVKNFVIRGNICMTHYCTRLDW